MMCVEGDGWKKLILWVIVRWRWGVNGYLYSGGCCMKFLCCGGYVLRVPVEWRVCVEAERRERLTLWVMWRVACLMEESCWEYLCKEGDMGGTCIKKESWVVPVGWRVSVGVDQEPAAAPAVRRCCPGLCTCPWSSPGPGRRSAVPPGSLKNTHTHTYIIFVVLAKNTYKDHVGPHS